MQRTTKAALYSALVFPGTGHYVLRKWIRGTLFLIPAMVSLGILVHYQLNVATEVVDKVLNGEIAPDLASIKKELQEPPPEKQALILKISLGLVLGCWAGASVDVYLIGRELLETAEPE